MDPSRLREGGYAPFLRLLRSAMRHGGALRLDHVMGLWRLWWVPRGRPATEGAYVRYPADELLGLVALESWRRRCIVVGEDLGTVAPGVRERMARERILGCRLVMFERGPGGFADSRGYFPLSVASFGTHDLPTFAGWWHGRDVSLRRKLGLFRTSREAAKAPAARAVEKRHLVETFARAGIRAGAGKDVPVEALHRFLGVSASVIALASLEDALLVEEQRNLPGTLREYHNWSGRLRLTVAELAASPWLRSAARGLAAGRGPADPPAGEGSEGTQSAVTAPYQKAGAP
jgi:4-alpha-glucanotransferase